jgi:hypothetical protein
MQVRGQGPLVGIGRNLDRALAVMAREQDQAKSYVCCLLLPKTWL